MTDNILHSFNRLKAYVETENYMGWDPFDALNSKLFQSLSVIKNNRIVKLIWLQFFKHNPINLRPLVGIPKEYNPKALGLFLTGYCKLYESYPKKEYLKKINWLADILLTLQSKGYSGGAWGYNFDWQARAFFQPKNTPTVVATSFVVEALLKAYKITQNKKYLDTAVSAQHFVLKDLNKTYEGENYCFSYSPLDKTQVFNAGLLGVKILSLIYSHTKDKSLLKEAKKVVQFVVNKQNSDGSWAYGTLPFHQWIDNFHTGYNIEALTTYQKVSGDNTYKKSIEKGLDYYLKHFFTKDGKAKYYHDKLYPIDIHAPAQLVVTLAKTNLLNQNKALVDKVLLWTINNMQDPKGYFYYQKKRFYTIKIPYMRWANAWMFYALSFYFGTDDIIALKNYKKTL